MASKGPHTPNHSPRGVGVSCGPFTKVRGQFRGPFSPWGEGQDEGVFIAAV